MLGNVFILGDSYSTFEGFIPDGYGAYYGPEGPDYIRNHPEMELNDNDVCSVEQTWWYEIVNEYGNLIKNCSYSGSTICNTGYGGRDFSNISFVGRIEKLLSEGYFWENKPDTLFLFGGTNDSWCDAPLGTDINSGWSKEDLYKVFPAFSYLINLLVTKFPETKIFCIFNTELKPEILNYYKDVCNNSNIDVVELYDIEKVHGHPTVKGMQEIKRQVKECIRL